MEALAVEPERLRRTKNLPRVQAGDDMPPAISLSIFPPDRGINVSHALHQYPPGFLGMDVDDAAGFVHLSNFLPSVFRRARQGDAGNYPKTLQRLPPFTEPLRRRL
jgi:hypothetical protein